MHNRLDFQFVPKTTAVSVTLHKTIRVANGDKAHDLPPSLGAFNYFVHEDNKVVPIGEKEALWFQFSGASAQFPVAIKIIAGGINAITGEKEEGENCRVLKDNKPGTKSGQNYMVVPGQKWLDGFKTQDSTVRQFIAVALGQGESVEEKLEGTMNGSIQIVVIPPSDELIAKLKERERLRLAVERSNPYGAGPPVVYKSLPAGARMSGGSRKATRMGLAAGGEIKQDIVVSPYTADEFNIMKAQYAELGILHADQFAELNRLPIPPRAPTHEEYTKAGRPWFSLQISQAHAVAVDPDSRLLALDKPGIVPGGMPAVSQLSALPPEPAAAPVPAHQIIVIRSGDDGGAAAAPADAGNDPLPIRQPNQLGGGFLAAPQMMFAGNAAAAAASPADLLSTQSGDIKGGEKSRLLSTDGDDKDEVKESMLDCCLRAFRCGR